MAPLAQAMRASTSSAASAAAPSGLLPLAPRCRGSPPPLLGRGPRRFAPSAFAAPPDPARARSPPPPPPAARAPPAAPPAPAVKVDTNLYHYLPAWLSPWTVALAGALVFGASVAAELSEGKEALGPHAVAVAAGPSAAFLFLALFLLPRQFRAFAKDYAKAHPDVIAEAAQELLEQQRLEELEQQQQQQEAQEEEAQEAAATASSSRRSQGN